MDKYWDFTLFQIGEFSLTVYALIMLLAFIVSIFIFLQIVRRLIYSRKSFNAAKKNTVYSLLKYFTVVVSLATGLQIVGIHLSVLLAGSAALLVGIGLGLQSLFSDFISGIILLIESSVKVNDVIEINGLVCKVQEINLRTTTVLTREDKYIILPNSDLTKNHLINWTHNHISSRFEVTVGVDYASNVNLIMKLLEEAADQHPQIMKTPSPVARFLDYGDSSLNFAVMFWSEEVFRIDNIKSEIRVKIFELFLEHHVTIPFPQRVIHLKT